MSESDIIIEAGRGERHYWRDVWRFRELFLILAWRDVAVRYKQTVIGIAWAVLRPFITMFVFTILFGRLAHLPSEGGAPYSLMVFAGMLPWYLISTSLSGAAESLLSNSSLIGKVYFPRLVIPTAACMSALIDFAVSLFLLAALMAWHGYVPNWQILLLPVWVLFALIASIGPGLWMAALNMKYRDFRFLLPFIMQIGLYVSPVGFSSTLVPPEWRLIYSLNPVVGVIDGFRWSILGDDANVFWPGVLAGLIVSLVLLWCGVRRFRQTEKSFADLI